VGYAGGQKENPTYHDLGDHTETLQIDFDPEVISYDELLDLFWASHDPGQRSWSRQYMAAVFYHDEEQKRAIQASITRIASQVRGEVKTSVLPFTGFTLAEGYHQKYALRRSQVVMEDFRAMYSKLEGFVDSTAAARVNGYLAGHGTCEGLKQEIDELGLSDEGSKSLLKAVCGWKEG
jgi:methionine-S-sulfoxide reductase